MAALKLPGSGWIVTARDLALIDHLWRQWSPGFSLDPALQAELHEHLRASMPAPLKYCRGMLRPGMLGATRRLSRPIAVPLLQLHGANDGCILPPAGRRPTSVCRPARAGSRPRRRSLPAYRGPRGDRGTDHGLGRVGEYGQSVGPENGRRMVRNVAVPTLALFWPAPAALRYTTCDRARRRLVLPDAGPRGLRHGPRARRNRRDLFRPQVSGDADTRPRRRHAGVPQRPAAAAAGRSHSLIPAVFHPVL